MASNRNAAVAQNLSREVQNVFSELYVALRNRETELLRQVDVVCQANLADSSLVGRLRFTADNVAELVADIARFGHLDCGTLPLQMTADTYLDVEEYQRPEADHLCLDKRLAGSPAICNLTFNKHKVDQLNAVCQKNLYQLEKSSNVITRSPPSRLSQTRLLPCIEHQDPSLCAHRSEGSTRENFSPAPETCASPTPKSTPVPQNQQTPAAQCECYELQETLRRMMCVEQPVQVRDWMRSIMRDPETEPVPCRELLEYTRIQPALS